MSHSFSSHKDLKLALLVNSQQDDLYINLGHLGNVVLRLSSYKSLQSLLDDLYLKYLKDDYQPYTYGRDWVLYSQETNRLIVSWSWLLKSSKDTLSTFDPGWATSSLWAYGLFPSTRLVILDKIQIKGYGVATNDDQIASLLTGGVFTDEKRRLALALLFKRMMGQKKLSYTGELAYNDKIHVDFCPPQMIDVNEYTFIFVFRHNENILLDRLAYIVKSYSQGG